MKLVLLHPLPLDGSSWPASITGLVDDCLAPDLYAFGDDIRDWARAVLDLVGTESMTLVGNSVGGSCAIEVAKLAPDRVAAIVLCGAKAGHDPDPEFRDEALRVLDEEGIDAAWERYWRPLFGPSVDEDVVAQARRRTRAIGATAVARGVRAFHGRPDRDAFLDSWTGPVWVVAGEHDLRPERARSMAARLRRGRHRVVAGAGHYVPIEAPGPFRSIVAEACLSATRGSP